MISRTFRMAVLGALVCVAGCMKSYTRPAAGNTLQLGGVEAEWHDFGAKLCDTDPRIVANEMRAVNELLLKYVDGTSAGTEGVWAEEHARMLDQGYRQLPPALEAYEATVRGIARCKADEKLGIADLSRRGEELVRQARARVEETPSLLPFAQASAALSKWKAQLPGLQATAKQEWCPPRVKRGSTDLYHVSSDEHGTTEYLFCDGSKVTRTAGGKPVYVSPDSKKVPTRPYFDASAAYPDSEIQRAPRLPARKVTADSGEEDEAGE